MTSDLSPSNLSYFNRAQTYLCSIKTLCAITTAPELICDRIAHPFWNRLISLQIHRYRYFKFEAMLNRKKQRNSLFRRKKRIRRAVEVAEQENRRTDRLPCVITTNARSIINKCGHINQLLQDSSADIACVTETSIKNANNDMVIRQIDNNYHVINTNRQDQIGGGTLILIKKRYSSSLEQIKPLALTFPEWYTVDYKKSLIELIIVKCRP